MCSTRWDLTKPKWMNQRMKRWTFCSTPLPSNRYRGDTCYREKSWTVFVVLVHFMLSDTVGWRFCVQALENKVRTQGRVCHLLFPSSTTFEKEKHHDIWHCQACCWIISSCIWLLYLSENRFIHLGIVQLNASCLKETLGSHETTTICMVINADIVMVSGKEGCVYHLKLERKLAPLCGRCTPSTQSDWPCETRGSTSSGIQSPKLNCI